MFDLFADTLSAVNQLAALDRKSTRLNSSHSQISYAVFCLKKKKNHDAATLRIYIANKSIHRERTSLPMRGPLASYMRLSSWTVATCSCSHYMHIPWFEQW